MALQGTATQSSAFGGFTEFFKASNAIDGSNSTFSHTEYLPNQWWQVDLNSVEDIDRVNGYDVIKFEFIVDSLSGGKPDNENHYEYNETTEEILNKIDEYYSKFYIGKKFVISVCFKNDNVTSVYFPGEEFMIVNYNGLEYRDIIAKAIDENFE